MAIILRPNGDVSSLVLSMDLRVAREVVWDLILEGYTRPAFPSAQALDLGNGITAVLNEEDPPADDHLRNEQARVYLWAAYGQGVDVVHGTLVVLFPHEQCLFPQVAAIVR